jgi:hypothetical protein
MLADSLLIAHPNHTGLPHKGKHLPGRRESVGCETWLVPAGHAVGADNDALANPLPAGARAAHIFLS